MIKDNDCHDYMIPADKINEFEAWLDSFDEWGCSDNPDPEWANRINCPPSFITFENPKEENWWGESYGLLKV